MARGHPDFQRASRIVAVDVDKLPVDIVAQSLGNVGIDIKNTITLPINIKQNDYGNLPVDVKASTTIPIDVVAQSVGNIGVDLKAQTVETLGIDIKAQTLENLKAQTVTIKGKIVSIPLIIKGYKQVMYYAGYSQRYILHEEPFESTDTSTCGKTSSTTWEEIYEVDFHLLLKRDVKVGGFCMIHIPAQIWVTGSIGHFRQRLKLCRLTPDGTVYVIKDWYTNEWMTDSTTAVEVSFPGDAEIDDYQLYANDYLRLEVHGEAYISESGYEAHMCALHDGHDKTIKAWIPWRLVDYE